MKLFEKVITILIFPFILYHEFWHFIFIFPLLIRKKISLKKITCSLDFSSSFAIKCVIKEGKISFIDVPFLVGMGLAPLLGIFFANWFFIPRIINTIGGQIVINDFWLIIYGGMFGACIPSITDLRSTWEHCKNIQFKIKF